MPHNPILLSANLSSTRAALKLILFPTIQKLPEVEICYSETDLALIHEAPCFDDSLETCIKYPILSFTIGESDPIPVNCHFGYFPEPKWDVQKYSTDLTEQSLVVY